MKDNFLSTQELGTLLGLTRQTIRNWIRKGDIKAFHIGQNLKIPLDEAVRLLTYYGLPFPDWLRKKPRTAHDATKPAPQRSWTNDERVVPAFSPHASSPVVEKVGRKWPQEAGNGR